MNTVMLTYAIGDIHGCADLLDALLEQIDSHAAGRARTLVFLGDYIDRGPDSARVVETLRKLQWREEEAVVCLMGNHEAMLLKTLHERGALDLWLQNGGAETLASFDADGPEDLPTDVLDWIEALPTLHEDARRWYVHAGFRPEAEVPDPDVETRLWMREPFLSEDHDFGRHVVHGHTPLSNGTPDVRAFRTNLDTGAVYGGALTAGVFTADQAKAVEFLAVRTT
ncbi:metallophosphoesterase family protein [Methylobacterium haplocladii]|uniref:Serine/threonine protein phosphatase n=1 Tax=Methylobacterium haplocladii TaxID=1176176 RepID=A0A512IR35_9HYPH|nr:metallophosphoesterase family protein [Methylobacterium haplocladii]GEP00151.1 serine/threonine protein phosphatase [Methylobacterium haplocladii]GJD82181.1 Serine/threonine-protein phosphatase 1 [Methylobacterium haplocladii]GLS60772.1 serine/threonine protein phosphatase [Methylobacterium haplocladii]